MAGVRTPALGTASLAGRAGICFARDLPWGDFVGVKTFFVADLPVCGFCTSLLKVFAA